VRYAIVTGDKGFVGRHFTRYLRKTGWNVIGCDIADGNDAREFFRVVDNMRVDLLVHCAAVVGGRETIDGAPLALASNLELDAGMFQWALRNKPGRVLYFSSSAVYPKHLQEHAATLPEYAVESSLSGSHVGMPDQLYGWAKLTGENLAHRARQEGLSVSVVRPFSGYGSDQDASYPFPAFIDRALRREDPFAIWGDGSQVRDFIHIDDIVAACMTMCGQGIDGPVNLGSGQPASMRELASLVCGQAHYAPEFKFDTAAPRGVSYRVSDSAALRQFYTPEASLERGIAQALAWRRRLL
jgi:nucleoside-diphosphate-sugar epimerase